MYLIEGDSMILNAILELCNVNHLEVILPGIVVQITGRLVSAQPEVDV